MHGPIWAILLFATGGFVPSIVGIILTRTLEGSPGLRRLLRQALKFQLGLRWYLVITLCALLGAAGQILINGALGHRFNIALFISQLPTFFPLLILGPVSEEFGWRGYLLEKLQQRWSALPSALTVGVVWGLWHLPLFYMLGTSQHELHLPFLSFLVGITSVSVIMTWIHNNTSGSLWAAIFFHWLYTYFAQVSSSGATRSSAYNWLESTPYVLLAAVTAIVWKAGRLRAGAFNFKKESPQDYGRS